MPVCCYRAEGSQRAPFIRLFQYGSTVAIFSNLNIINGVIPYCVLSYLTPFWAKTWIFPPIHIFEYPTDLACSWKTPWSSAEMNLMLQLCCFPWHASPRYKVVCSSGSLYTTVLLPDSSAQLQETFTSCMILLVKLRSLLPEKVSEM